MANSARITYRGEVLCCLDQTEVKAVEPYLFRKPLPRKVYKRIWDGLVAFFTGSQPPLAMSESEEQTRILFKDGSSLIIKIPFYEFINGYC